MWFVDLIRPDGVVTVYSFATRREAIAFIALVESEIAKSVELNDWSVSVPYQSPQDFYTPRAH
jgi:hypothetical protein